MAFFGTSRRVARRTARRTSRRWGMINQAAMQQQQPQQQEPQQQPSQGQVEDPVKLLQIRLAKGEITQEKYQELLKILQSN